MKRISRAAVVCTAAVAIGAPTAAYALNAPDHAPAGAPRPHVLVVKPGQKVRAPNGRSVWLGKDSGLCGLMKVKASRTTTSSHGGSPVTHNWTVYACSGGPKAPSPRVEWTLSDVTSNHHMLVSGDYISGKTPAGVRVRLNDGRWHEGTVLRLPGNPGRGVWFADLGPAPKYVKSTSVVVYDKAGHPVAPQKPAFATGAQVD
ncbi:hypothetical protein [Streptomyces sp. CA-111067]|uniref:hypothetical protein n=1 Tax=Streptomyces sp. CA-111067 TaxID=3240046 RepID=UPI003D97A3F0